MNLMMLFVGAMLFSSPAFAGKVHWGSSKIDRVDACRTAHSNADGDALKRNRCIKSCFGKKGEPKPQMCSYDKNTETHWCRAVTHNQKGTCGIYEFPVKINGRL